MHNIDRDRALFALKVINDAKKVGVKQKELRSYINGLPAMLRINGLSQTALFLKEKAKKDGQIGAYSLLLSCLSGWITRRLHVEGDLVTALIEMGQAEYQQATAELTAFVPWLVRIGRAELDADEAGAANA